MKGSRDRNFCLARVVLLLLLCSVLPVSAIDSPHSSGPGYGFTCGNCHWTHASGSAPWATVVNAPDPADDTLNNRRCYACHDGSKAGIPAAGTHSTSTTSTRFWSTLGWRTECVTCHDPHQQRQARTWGTASYVASGPAPVTVGTWNTSAGNWTTVTVSSTLAADYTGYYFMPDRYYPYFYEVVEDTTGKTTFKVKGSVNAAYVRTGGYAFVYGKNVRELISYLNPGGATVGGTVKLFRPGGANGPADAANTATSVCRVCHTQGTHWSAIGDAEHNNLATCSSCHQHLAGFKAICIDCHGGPPVLDTPTPTTGLVWTTPTGSATAGAHAAHVNDKTIPCSACHYGSVANGPTHNSGKITMGFYNLGGATQGGTYNGQSSANYDTTTTSPATSVSNTGSKTCSNVYCHGASMAPNGGTSTTPLWTSGATAPCGSCHGATAANPPLRGSHRTHVMNDIWSHAPNTDPPFNNYIYGRNLACTVCHNNYTAAHVNGSAEWLFDTAAYPRNAGARYKGSSSGSSSPVPGAYGQCDNLYCHSIAQTAVGGPLTGLPGEYKTPTWGSLDTGTCGSCHYADQGHSYWADRGMTAPEIDSGSHAKHLQSLTATVGGGSNGPGRCGACHNYVGSDSLSGCASVCHNRNDLHVDQKVDVKFPPTLYGAAAVYNGTPAPGDGYSNCSNTYCHSNGTSVSTGAIPANTSPTWGAGTLPCSTCHGTPPAYTSGSPKANSHLSHTAATCDKCHSATTTDGATIAGYAAHVNKSYDLQAGTGIGFSYAFSTTGGSCSSISCHGSSADSRWGDAASVTCLGCHSVSQGNRVAITSQFAANSHHVQWSTVTGAHCYQCHWEANSDGTINRAYHGGAAASNAPVDLVVRGISTARPSWYTTGGPNVSAVQYTAYPQSRSEIAKINTACLGCHNDVNKDTDAFGDGKTPRQYAWDSTSVAARYSQWGTTNWGKYASYSGAAKKDLTKAFSAHGNSASNYGGGWSSAPNGTGNDGPLTPTRGGASAVNVACFDCHNSHGSTAAGVTTSYASATASGGLLKDTTAGKGGYAVTYKPVAGGSAASKNAYNPGGALCFDCHLNAVWGTTPWGYSSTYNASQPILGYFDTAFFASGTFPSQQRFPYKEGGHQGGHLGAWSTLSSAPSKQINGLCTPCHDPHGVSPTLGANQAYGVPLLKGTFVTSPYKEDAAPANNGPQSYIAGDVGYRIDQNTFGTDIFQNVTGVTQADTQFAGLCLGCHAKTTLTNGTTHDWKSKDRIHESVKGWKTANATVKHNYTCSKCHTPHNSRLPRLMVSNCMNTDHKGRTRFNASPVLSASNIENHEGSDTYYGGSGSGRIPGSYSGTWEGTHLGTCHENNTGSGTNQSWNTKTPWAPVPVITAGPSAASFVAVGTDVQATITWSTDTPSTSVVDFGLTAGYGATTSGATGVLNHSVTITMPAVSMNHQTVHFRVRSGTISGEAVSGDYTFYISVPPTVPVLIDEPNAACAGSCAVVLQYSSTDPDSGPIEYQIEVDASSSFDTADKQTSPWTSGTDWSPTLATNKTWYWRVKSRDANHITINDPVSAWSTLDSFILSDGTPVLLAPNNNDSSSTSCGVYSAVINFSWAGSSPFTEFYVMVDNNPDFSSPEYYTPSWTTATAWGPAVGTGTWYWKVGARDPLNPGTEKWSGVRVVTLNYGGDCVPSCPVFYAWDGTKYAFEIDLYSRGILGRQIGTGYQRPNPHDYYLIASTPVAKDGYLEMKFVEERSEVDYVDKVTLYTVDVPEGKNIYAEANVTTDPTYYPPTQILHTVDFAEQHPISAIHVNTGQDVSAKIAAPDGEYLILNPDRENPSWQTIEMNLGDLSTAPKIKLILKGIQAFPLTPAGYAKVAALKSAFLVKIEVPDGTGGWIDKTNQIRIANLTEFLRPMLVDITSIFQNNDYRIRLSYFAKNLIDSVTFDTTADVPMEITELPLASADLSYGGFNLRSKVYDDIETYTYGVKIDKPIAVMPGNYTRFGDVTPLLSSIDDKFVIVFQADELTYKFTPPAPVTSGTYRKFLLYGNGYYKAYRYVNTRTVDPLPFGAMSNYPYDPAVEHYPDDAEHNQYRTDYNTRIIAP